MMIQTNWVGGLPLAYRNMKIARSVRDDVLWQLRMTPRVSANSLTLSLHVNGVRVKKALTELVDEGLVRSEVGYRNATVYWSVK